MKTIGMFEAKTHLPEIIRDVENGQQICLTNHNKVAAFIISAEQFYKNKNDDIFIKLDELKKHAPIGNISEILDMRDEGKK